jgi:hypothetical protein
MDTRTLEESVRKFSHGDRSLAAVAGMMPPRAWLCLALLVAVLWLFQNAKRLFWVFSLLVLPGTFCHELCHYLSGQLLNGRPVAFTIYPRDEGDRIQLGAVMLSNGPVAPPLCTAGFAVGDLERHDLVAGPRSGSGSARVFFARIRLIRGVVLVLLPQDRRGFGQQVPKRRIFPGQERSNALDHPLQQGG